MLESTSYSCSSCAFEANPLLRKNSVLLGEKGREGGGITVDNAASFLGRALLLKKRAKRAGSVLWCSCSLFVLRPIGRHWRCRLLHMICFSNAMEGQIYAWFTSIVEVGNINHINWSLLKEIGILKHFIFKKIEENRWNRKMLSKAPSNHIFRLFKR